MLKPKRKITKQELKTDPFLEFIGESREWFNARKKLIYQIGIGIIAALAILFFVNINKTKSSAKSGALLGKALLYQDLGDIDNTKFELQNLVDEYEGTVAATDGNFYLGKILYDSGEIEAATEFLQEFVKKSKNRLLIVAAYKTLAEVAVKNEEFAEAESLLQKCAKNAENTIYKDEIALLLANQLLINNKKGKANKIIEEILAQEDILFSTKKLAEELKGRIIG